MPHEILNAQRPASEAGWAPITLIEDGPPGTAELQLGIFRVPYE